MPAAIVPQPEESEIIEYHETRLTAMEAGIRELTGKVAENVSNTANVKDAVETLGGRFESALEKMTSHLSEALSEHVKSDAAVFSEHSGKIKDLEEEKKKRSDRREFWKKLAWGLGLPIGTLVVREGWAWLWSVLHAVQQLPGVK